MRNGQQDKINFPSRSEVNIEVTYWGHPNSMFCMILAKMHANVGSGAEKSLI